MGAGSIGDCVLFDSLLAQWVQNNERNGGKGVTLSIARLLFLGIYPGNDKGVQQIMKDLRGLKLFRTFDDGKDLHVILCSYV